MSEETKQPENPELANGTTLRDYFAGKAMQGITTLASIDCEGLNLNRYRVNGPYLDVSLIAQESYELADAMLKARMNP